jgi:hypothetical protein
MHEPGVLGCPICYKRGACLIEVLKMRRMLAATIGFLALTTAARAQPPVAVVEDVQGKVSGAEFMDYVVPGQVIKLGPGGSIVLSYMKSCWRETISGVGTVIVGTEESAVHLAEFKAGKVPCDPTQTEHVAKEVGESAATVVRSLKDGAPKEPPPLTLHGLSPVMAVSDRGKLIVERIDVKGEHYEVDLARAALVHGKFYDFAKTNTALKPGGTYAATLKSKRIIFQVAADANSGSSPIVGRLVSLQ